MLSSTFSVTTYNYRNKLDIIISEFCYEISITLYHFLLCIFFSLAFSSPERIKPNISPHLSIIKILS